MKIRRLSKYLEKLESLQSRNEMTVVLSELFDESEETEIDKTIYLLMGRLGPRYETQVFNVAERMMLAVLANAYNRDVEEVRTIYKRLGDVGDVVYLLSKEISSRGKALSVVEVFNKLEAVAKDEGEGSQERKVNLLAHLLRQLDSKSAKFVARIPVARLRLGFSDKTILDALSWMQSGDKSLKEELDKAYQVLPDVGLLAKNVKKYGVEKATQGVVPKVGIPVLPMLAQRLKSPDEMIKKMKTVAVEPKLDGLRIQIHLKKGKNGLLKAFTRNLNETSWMFPELKKISKYIKTGEVILDTEAVGVDESRQKMANFQTTMIRRRKHEIEKFRNKVPIKFFCFDILSSGGKSLMDKGYKERRKELERVVKKGSVLDVVDYKITKSPKEIRKLNKVQRSKGYEGIMIKMVEASYVPGRTGWRWVKMKEDESSAGKLTDTIDCVILGYSRGRGRRAGFGVGQFLAAIRQQGKFLTITKVGTGLTDDQFRELSARLSKLEVAKKPKEYQVQKDYYPDFWVHPKVVVELAGDDITKSPRHTSEYAVRFPRLVKFRDDKSPREITSLKELNNMFKEQ